MIFDHFCHSEIAVCVASREPQPRRFLTVRPWRAGAKIILGSRYSAARRAYPFGHSGSTDLKYRSTGKKPPLLQERVGERDVVNATPLIRSHSPSKDGRL